MLERELKQETNLKWGYTIKTKIYCVNFTVDSLSLDYLYHELSQGVGACVSWRWTRGRVHPGQVTSSLQGWHLETHIHPHLWTGTFLLRVNQCTTVLPSLLTITKILFCKHFTHFLNPLREPEVLTSSLCSLQRISSSSSSDCFLSFLTRLHVVKSCGSVAPRQPERRGVHLLLKV